MKKEDLNNCTISIFKNTDFNFFGKQITVYQTQINEKLRIAVTNIAQKIYDARYIRVNGRFTVSNISNDVIINIKKEKIKKDEEGIEFIDINAFSGIVLAHEPANDKRPKKSWWNEKKQDWPFITCREYINKIISISTDKDKIADIKSINLKTSNDEKAKHLSIYFDLYGLTNGNNTIPSVTIESNTLGTNNPVYINGSNINTCELNSDDTLFINTSIDYINTIFNDGIGFNNNNTPKITITSMIVNDQTELINTEKIQQLTLKVGDAFIINYGQISTINITNDIVLAPKIINHNKIGIISEAPALELINAGTISSVTLNDKKLLGVRTYY